MCDMKNRFIWENDPRFKNRFIPQVIEMQRGSVEVIIRAEGDHGG